MNMHLENLNYTILAESGVIHRLQFNAIANPCFHIQNIHI